MTLDSIITEWRFRLPHGYPTTSHDYNILQDVLLELTSITEVEAKNIVRKAMGIYDEPVMGVESHFINEGIHIDSIENQQLKDAITSAGKATEFQEFLSLLPTEADAITLKYLNRLTGDQTVEFANLLYSQTDVNEDSLNSVNFRNGVGVELFNLEPKGLGKGEIFLAALINDSKINGGGESFDMSVNGARYEVKDYQGGTSKFKSIRLGTKGSVTRFDFWDEIVTTLKRLNQLRGTLENPKFDFKKYFDRDLLNSIEYLDSRRPEILAGNLNMKDKRYLDQFYQEANKLNSDIQGYTNIILRGPNASPIEMSIEPIVKKEDGSIIIKPIANNSQDITYINAELRRLKYVRNPAELDVDLQKAVDLVVGDDLQFIVFRKDRVRVTNEFRYSVIDQGKIRIVEKAIVSEDIDHSDLELYED
jgi:hypothetical protein